MDQKIGEILVQKKLITWKQLEEVLTEQQQTKEMTGQLLIRKGYVSELLFYKALGEQYQIRFVDLERIRINPKVLALIPKEVSEAHQIMPVDVKADSLSVAVGNPTHVWPRHEIQKLAGVNGVQVVLALPQAVQKAIQENYA